MYLKIRVGRDEPLPAVTTADAARPWKEGRQHAVLAYVLGIGAERGEGARMPPDVFEELLGYVGRRGRCW